MNYWFLYMIRTRLGSLYTGITNDLDRRLIEHTGTGGKGAKYLRAKGPLALVYRTKIGNRALALKAEKRIKRLTKRKKEKIVSENPEGKDLLELLKIQIPG